MHVGHLDDLASPLTVVSAPSFRRKEWRNFALVIGAPDRRSNQRHYSTHS
jgi:hypothetical protein